MVETRRLSTHISIRSLIGTSVGILVMVGRLEAGEVGRILKCGSPCLRLARREARRS